MTKWFMLLCVAALSLSCTEDPIEAPATEQTEAQQPQTTRAGVVFEKMANPYRLAIMQAVCDSLSSDVKRLHPTDLYVRVKPQNNDQLSWLMEQSGFEMFNYPLDIKIEEGQEYVDPTIAEGEQGWLYTTVKPGFTFPSGYVWELLDECYIPKEGETIPPATRGNPEIDLERAAFERTGYELPPQTRGNVKPRGTIRVWDNSRNEWVGVMGVKIRCHIVVKWSTTYTDTDGNYTMDSNFFLGPHYAIVYDNSRGFTIWGQYYCFAAANHGLGWHNQKGYSKDIGSNDDKWKWAVGNNAGYEYYRMCESEGIHKPPKGLRIFFNRGGEMNSAPMLRRVSAGQILTKDNWLTYLTWALGGAPVGLTIIDGLLKWAEPDLIIGAKGMTKYRDIYEVMSHELSHASHFSQVGSNYWAKYISHIIQYLGYGYSRTGTYAGICEVGEMWGYAMGHIQECEKYEIDRLGRPYYWNLSDDGQWIRPHAIWDLYRNKLLTRQQIFECLTDDVESVAQLKNKMSQRYPDKAVYIGMAFSDEGLNYSLFTDRIIDTYLTVSWFSIYLQNITVRNGGSLILQSPSVTIDEPFMVEFGGVFEITN